MGAKQAKHSAETVCNERRRYLSMTIADRRRHYHCGSRYTKLADIQPWPAYFARNINSTVRQTYRYPAVDALNDKVSVWQGDITRLEIDGIVNSACDPAKGKGAVNKALYENAGEYYQDECLLKGLPEPGQTKVTGGYQTPAKYVIHTVPPKSRSADILVNCYKNSLETALGHGIRSVAFPCLSTNKFLGFSVSKAAHIALATTRHWLEDNGDHIDRIVFCVYSEADLRVYKELLQIYFPLSTTRTPSELEDESEEQLADLMLAHHIMRVITGSRPQGRVQTPDDPAARPSKSKTIADWQDETAQPQFQPIRLDRSGDVPMVKILHQLYNHPDMDYRRRPLMQFTGEDGLDLGALSREFFYKNLEALTEGPVVTSPAFEGPPGRRLPCASRVHARTGVYELVGKVLAHSVLHDGVGLAGLSPALVFLLTHRVTREEVDVSGIPLDVDDVADADLQVLLKKAETIDSLDQAETQTVKQDLMVAMERCNYGYSPINSTTLPSIKQELVLYEVIFKRWDQIEQIRQGMEVVGLYSFLCDHPTPGNTCRVFPTAADSEILPLMVRGKLEPANSSNRHYGYFLELLEEIHAGKLEDSSLRDLLSFWTGHPALPEGKLHVVVNDDGKYPVANCCFFKLELPGATASFEEFKESFFIALTSGATGFTRT